MEKKKYKDEEWRDIKGYEGRYMVSNKGRVKSIVFRNNLFGKGIFEKKQDKLLTPTDNGHGYKIVGLSKDKRTKNFYVHRLVAEAFIGEIGEDKVINHLDHDRSNNAADNLEIVTQAENVKYSIPRMIHPRRDISHPNKYISVNHNKSSITYGVTIRRTYVGTYKTIEEARIARDEFIRKINYY